MDELYFDNKKYVTTKKAAALANYAKDYVGQLARAGKVDARLIGRNWYISEEALLEHAFGGKAKLKSAGNDSIEPAGEQVEEAPILRDTIERGQVGVVTDVHYANGNQSQLNEPIQNYGLDIDVSASENLQDEIQKDGGVSGVSDYGGRVTYWSDDAVLMPTMAPHGRRDASRDDGYVLDAPMDYLIEQSDTDTHELASDRVTAHHSIQREDVSKITLTLRNRLKEAAPQNTISRAVQRSNMKKSEPFHSEGDLVTVGHSSDTWHVDVSMVIKVAIFLVCLTVLIALVFAMTGETSTTYIRK